MTSELAYRAAERRVGSLRTRLRRNKLIFVQCGMIHAPIQQPLIDLTSSASLSAEEFLELLPDPADIDSGALILTGVEILAEESSKPGATLGKLRVAVNKFLDADVSVCLFSSAPRAAFGNTPGSSVIQDSTVYTIPLLEESECDPRHIDNVAYRWPCVGLERHDELSEVLRHSLRELGMMSLAAFDHAFFEAPYGVDFVQRLDSRELEALRGAGLLVLDHNGTAELALENRLSQFKEALADVLAEMNHPQRDFPTVMTCLWFIERTIRHTLRSRASSHYGLRWRIRVLNSDLQKRVLERARSDVNVFARSVSELRDPIEWLSLGELVELAMSKEFDGLNFDKLEWEKFKQEVMPVRNRTSHMRLLRNGDREVVEMWRALVARNFS